MADPRASDFRMALSSARHDAHQASDALTKAWAIALHAPSKPEELARELRQAAAALQRLNDYAAQLGIASALPRPMDGFAPDGTLDSESGRVAMFPERARRPTRANGSGDVA